MVVAKLNGNWGFYLDYSVSTVSQSKPNNNSVIRVSVSIGTPYSISWTNASRNVNISVAGQSKTLAVGSLNLNNSRKSLGSVDFTIGHNSTGDATASISISVDLGNVVYGSLRAGSVSTSYSYRLAKIIRQSTFSLSTSNVNTGSAVTVNISRANGSYTHNIKYKIGSASGSVATGVATSYTWTVPTSLNSQMPNSTSLTGTITVETYSGSTLIGSNQTNITINVPSNIIPSFTGVTLSDTNTKVQTLIPEANYYVQILSNINVVFNGATGNSGSTISGYYAEIKGKGQVITSNNTALGLMNYSGSIVISAKVQDSRGRWSAVKETTVTVLPYHPPVLSISVQRTGSARNTLTVTRNVSIAPLTVKTTNRNLGTLHFRVSHANSESYGAEINKQDTNGLTNSNVNLVGTFSGNTAWKVKAFLVDKLTTTPVTATDAVSTEKVVYYYDENGFAVGKIREKYMFEAAGDVSIPTNAVYRRGNVEIQNHALTNSNGSTIRKDNADFNSLKNTGFYLVGGNVTNHPNPGSTYYYLTVINSDVSNYCYQMAVDRNDGTIFTRICENGTWRPWKTYARVDHPNLVNTGWVTIGNGFKYKRVGDVVYLNYGFRTNSVATFGVGRIPAELVPKNMMFEITAWTRNPNRTIHVQVNADGSISWLNEVYKFNEEYHGQLSWAI